MVIQDNYCNRCDKKYTYVNCNWCRPCQKNDLKTNFKNWTSSNEKVDVFIQEMQSKIKSYRDIVFEWIPYDQFIDVKEIGKGGFATIYSATWNGLLKYDTDVMEYKRYQVKVALICFDNSQNNIYEFLDKV